MSSLEPTDSRVAKVRRCQRCEYWDAGGEAKKLSARIGDCLNRNGDRFTPEWNHSCSAFYPDTGEPGFE